MKCHLSAVPVRTVLKHAAVLQQKSFLLLSCPLPPDCRARTADGTVVPVLLVTTVPKPDCDASQKFDAARAPTISPTAHV
jgi:hypothetical protein